MEFIKQTYSEQAAEFVRQLIHTGELEPGDTVKEVMIAKRLAISRAPVREAMQILMREGLIDAAPQKQKKVRRLTAQQIRNSYFTGGVLEGAAVAGALERYTPEDFRELEATVEEMKAVAASGGSVEMVVPLDTRFHGLLFSRIDNDLIVELCRRCCQGISKYLLFRHWVKLFSAEKVYLRHLEVLDVLKTGDAARVEAALREHYTASGEKMAAYGCDVEETTTAAAP